MLIQRKKVKRKKPRAQKKPTVISPEALAETWTIVEQELRATGFQVCVWAHLGNSRGQEHTGWVTSYAALTLRIRCTNSGCFGSSCSQLSASVTEIAVPFDATSETPLEEQRTEAMVRVQDAVLARLGPEALGLLRAARSIKFHASDWWDCFFYILCTYHPFGTQREVWPEGDVFGSADVEPEEELELLKQILHANLPSELFKIQILSFFSSCPKMCSPFQHCYFKGLGNLYRRRRRRRMQQSWKRKNWSLSRSLRASLTFWTSSSGEKNHFLPCF